MDGKKKKKEGGDERRGQALPVIHDEEAENKTLCWNTEYGTTQTSLRSAPTKLLIKPPT